MVLGPCYSLCISYEGALINPPGSATLRRNSIKIVGHIYVANT